MLINKAMIEIPPKFAGRSPVHPATRKEKTLLAREWRGAQGLAEDVWRYGQWMRDLARQRIGHLYPNVTVTSEMVRERPDLKPYEGENLTVIAWLWARTVPSPNPAYHHVEVPLVGTFVLSSKAGKEAYVEPVIGPNGYIFTVKVGKPPDKAKWGTKAARGSFRCLMSETPIDSLYLRTEAQAGRMGQKLMAIVAEGKKGRVYLSPLPEHETTADSALPSWKPETAFFQQALGFRVGNYGMNNWSDLFTPRQLVALTTFSDLVGEAREQIYKDALAAGLPDDAPLEVGGIGAIAYSESISMYLGFIIDKMADLGNSLCRWEPVAQCPRQLFARQAISMVWDFAEANPLGESSGSWTVLVDGFRKAFSKSFETVKSMPSGFASQADSQTQTLSSGKVISTDPPYYDNIGYADLSDFFLRLAATFTAVSLSLAPSHHCRSQGRGTGRYAIPSWR